MTASEEIAERRRKYDRIERATDSTGRCIGVKRLKPSQQLAVQGMAPELDNVSSYRFLHMAATVVEINGDVIPFPRSRADLNAILDRLDEEGLLAVGEAHLKFAPAPGEAAKPVEEVAKN